MKLSSPTETSTDSVVPMPPPTMYIKGTTARTRATATTAMRVPLDHEGSGEPLLSPLKIGATMSTMDSPIRSSPTMRLYVMKAHARARTMVPMTIHFPQREAISLDSLSFLVLQSTPTLRNLYPLPCIHWQSPMQTIGMQQNMTIATKNIWNMLQPKAHAIIVAAAGTATARTA